MFIITFVFTQPLSKSSNEEGKKIYIFTDTFKHKVTLMLVPQTKTKQEYPEVWKLCQETYLTDRHFLRGLLELGISEQVSMNT